MTEDEFRNYWTERHTPLASVWFAHFDNASIILRKPTHGLAVGAAESFGWTLSPYDGHVEILVRNMEALTRATRDPEYPEKVGLDEQRFLEQARSMVTAGWEEVYVLDGKVVNFDEKGQSVY
ncbi:hypothetical protein BDZ45DRAFT_747870 [Acephala macrosclerotiorum]|nr:hypothetical protein BDZ45DRAFT_747870 [Acephala macrosclerotiorum]